MLARTSSLVPFLLVGIVGCPQSQDTGLNKVDTCAGPELAALVDQSVDLGETVTIPADATPCKPEDELTYSWTLDSAPLDSVQDTSSLNVTDPKNPNWKPDVIGTYVVGLTVSDGAGRSAAPVYAVITVSSGNEKPVADCGGNRTGTQDDRVDLDGSGSDDPEGEALEYDWSLASAPDCSGLDQDDIFNGDQSMASIVPDCAGVFLVSLVVGDGLNWSEPDYCTVTVDSDNGIPVADAGDSETLSPCTAPDFHLDGWGSYDPDGDTLTYAWTLLSAPSGSAGYFSSDPNQPDPYFRWDIPGDYLFQLQVCDPEQCSAPDIVTYSFVDASENNPPTANAGDDQTIDVETDCETSAYVFTCEDCEPESVTLDGSASIDSVDGDELDFFWTESTGEITIAAPTSPVTAVTTPGFPSTYNTVTTKSWTVGLTVSDCSESDTDWVTVTYNCTGTY
jgi:hypothetical protein